MGGITFWIAGLAVPALLIMLNAYLRHIIGLGQSACADVAMMLIAFDIAVLISPREFEAWIAFPVFVSDLPAVLIVNLLIGLICWIRLIVSERQLELMRRGELARVPVASLFFALVLPVFMMFLNLTPFRQCYTSHR
jgi:hypothetical protein